MERGHCYRRVKHVPSFPSARLKSRRYSKFGQGGRGLGRERTGGVVREPSDIRNQPMSSYSFECPIGAASYHSTKQCANDSTQGRWKLSPLISSASWLGHPASHSFGILCEPQKTWQVSVKCKAKHHICIGSKCTRPRTFASNLIKCTACYRVPTPYLINNKGQRQYMSAICTVLAIERKKVI